MRTKSVTVLMFQLAMLACMVYVVGVGGYRSIYVIKSTLVAAQIGGAEKFGQLREDARKHAKRFIQNHGGSAWFQQDELDTGQPTVYVMLHIGESYTIWPDGRVEKN